MSLRHSIRQISWLFIILSLLLGACGRVTEAPSPGPGPSATPSGAAAGTSTPESASLTPTATNIGGYPGPPTPTEDKYPGPDTPQPTHAGYPGPDTPEPTQAGYPGPDTPEPTQVGYPGPLTPTPRSATVTATGQTTVLPPPGSVTPQVSGTPTERPITTAEPPPTRQMVTISIWHSWNFAEQQVLDYALRQFQSIYPNVAFMVTYYPEAQLRSAYEAAAYRNQGPSLLLAPAEWGPAYYDQGLVLDVAEIAEAEFLATINPAALEESRYQGALIGLPHRIRSGVVMYRNASIIPAAPATFDELIALAQGATGGGSAGAYLDRSFEFSGASLPGIGGQWMDAEGLPAFNNQRTLDWLALLDAYEQAGVAGLNTGRDVQLFSAGKIGIIFESTLRQAELAEAIGAENLSIDPWPTYGSGWLSGFLYTDSLYANPRTTGDERYNALLVMGFFLAPEVQAIFSTAGHIPVVSNVSVEDAWMQQAIEAFRRGSPYPVDPAFAVYPGPIQQALRSIFELNVDPSTALSQAEQQILEALP